MATQKNIGPWSSPLDKLREKGLQASATWNPGVIPNSSGEDKDVTVTGAALGDFALVSFSLDVTGIVLDAQVTAANTVTAVMSNNTGQSKNLAEGTLYVKVIPRT